MKRRPVKRFFHSVFFKLVLVFAATGFGIMILAGFFFHTYRHLAEGPLDRNLVRYIDYLIEDMGDPPELNRARELAAATGMKILYHGSSGSWSTVEDGSSMPDSRGVTWYDRDGVRVTSWRGQHLVAVDRGGDRFRFMMDRTPPPPSQVHAVGAAFFLALLVLLAGAYLCIRWILMPVRWLDEGVRRIGEGDLDHRVPEQRPDELGSLGKAFNRMTDRIGTLLRTKDQMLLDISHELRSPLTRIKVAIEFLPEGAHREKISSDVHEMEGMISGILSAAKDIRSQETLSLQEVDLGRLLGNVADSFENEGPGVVYEAGHRAMIFGDADKLSTALTNIVSNAVKYSQAASRPVRISLNQEPEEVAVTIADAGIGIPPEDLPFVFEPFYRVDKARTRDTGGFGLGLSLVKRIVEAHLGRIHIESEPGTGTRVVLRLPRNPAAAS